MGVPAILFYFSAGLAVLSALVAVTVRNTVHGVLWLVLCFVATAAVWLLLETEFLALVLVLVYVGAVMTLFLFVVMMLDLRQAEKKRSRIAFWPLAVVILLVLMGLLLAVIHHGEGSVAVGQLVPTYSKNYSNVADLGSVLYTTWVWPFEIAAVLLLTAIVAAIALAHRRVPMRNTRKQDPAWQASVRPADRVRLVKMPSEKKT